MRRCGCHVQAVTRDMQRAHARALTHESTWALAHGSACERVCAHARVHVLVRVSLSVPAHGRRNAPSLSGRAGGDPRLPPYVQKNVAWLEVPVHVACLHTAPRQRERQRAQDEARVGRRHPRPHTPPHRSE
eukprot:2876013-Pleurochrysis_carterae.AAC.1